MGLPPNLKVSDDFADPFIGLEWRPRRGNWEFLLQGDIGGGADADFTWGTVFAASYQFSKRWSVKGAYRFLDVDFESDELVFDMFLEGLMLGVGYKF